MAFEDKLLFNEIAAKALAMSQYADIAETVYLKFSENATYLVRNKETGNSEAVLRISRPGYRTKSELQSEMKWLNEIDSYTPLIVGKPIPSDQGDWIYTVHVNGKDYFVTFFQFLNGEKIDEADEIGIVNNFRLLGETTAYLHKHVKIWNGAKKLDRRQWTYETTLGKEAVWGDWRAAPDLTHAGLEILNTADRIIEKRLHRYGRNERNFGLIHSDLRLANLLIKDGTIQIFDFDDCGYGWYMADLACALSLLETKPYLERIINAWLEGYRKVLPITDVDFDEIDTFIMLRRLQAMAWIASHADSDPEMIAQMSDGYTDGTIMLSKRYIQLYGKDERNEGIKNYY